MSARPQVFTIPAGAPFLPVLADALLAGRLAPLPGPDPLALADVTVLLPTRRAVRAFREVMAGKLGEGAAISLFLFPLLVLVSIGMLFFARRAQVS